MNERLSEFYLKMIKEAAKQAGAEVNFGWDKRLRNDLQSSVDMKRLDILYDGLLGKEVQNELEVIDLVKELSNTIVSCKKVLSYAVRQICFEPCKRYFWDKDAQEHPWEIKFEVLD